MRFVWFLNFWGWSRESHRTGMILHHPLEGIGGNWDEWFTNEATPLERAEIEAVGQSEDSQGKFWEWLGGVWIHEAADDGNQLALGFVGDELARVAPFAGWAAFARRHVPVLAGTVAAVVLGGESDGRAEDVRRVDAYLLPVAVLSRSRTIVTEGFQADAAELNAARESALQLLCGGAGWRLFARWVAAGRRPFPSWLVTALTGGWLVVGTLIAWLWVGPDPGRNLQAVGAALVGLWSSLVIVSVAVGSVQVYRAFSAGRRSAALLARVQIRLRLPGRFTLKGGSAGLPFAIGILHALARAYPRSLRASWLWRQFSDELEKSSATWAATGVTTSVGQIQPVEFPAKLRACLRQGKIADLLAPVQPESGGEAVAKLVAENGLQAPSERRGATEKRGTLRQRVRIHRCRHLADGVFAIGKMLSLRQAWVNAVAFGLSGIMLFALPDLWRILLPPPAPVAVAPSSPSPYFLWVSLETRDPDFFQVVLDSPVWANRRADIAFRRSQPASVRAEIRLVRLSEATIRNLEEGVVWIERRPRFLTRRFESGEIVGRYTMNYLNRLRHE